MFRAVCYVLVVGFWSAIISAIQAKEPEFKFENTPENLLAYVQQMHQLAYVKKDTAAADAMFMALIPDEARAKLALRDDAAALATAIADGFARIPAEQLAFSQKALAENTQISVQAATTEDLIKNEKGSVAETEFPKWAPKVASKALRPGVTFYEVKLTEPTKDFGTRFHLFYWDGKQWAMLGTVWLVARPAK